MYIGIILIDSKMQKHESKSVMIDSAIKAHSLDRLASSRVFVGIALNPIPTLRRLHEQYGSFVILSYPTSRRTKPLELVCIADPVLYRSVASDSETWRTVNVSFRGFGRRSAATRMGLTMTRLRGQQHAHYRRLMTPPLTKSAVFAHADAMYSIASRHVEKWKVDEPVDFAQLGMTLMQDLFSDFAFYGELQFARTSRQVLFRRVDAL